MKEVRNLRFNFSAWFDKPEGGARRGAVVLSVLADQLLLARDPDVILSALAEDAIGILVLDLKPFDGMPFERKREITVTRRVENPIESMSWPEFARRRYSVEKDYVFEVEVSLRPTRMTRKRSGR